MTFENFASEGPLKISEERAEEIFINEIVPQIGAKGEPPKQRTFVVVAGQPGSGKSTTINQAARTLSEATQKLIGDDFAAWVPGYYELAKADPVNAPNAAEKAGASHFYRATLSRALDMKANIVLELADPRGCKEQAELGRRNGYRTELHIVATPHYQSWTGVLHRAAQALENGHIGTNVLVPRAAYDRTYPLWPRAIFDAEENKRFDRLLIKRRDGTVAYDNHLVQYRGGTKTWAEPPRALEALLRERHRIVSAADAEQVEHAWQKIEASPHLRHIFGAGSPRLQQYRDEVEKYVISDETPEALKQARANLVADLNAASNQLAMGFGQSNLFAGRMDAYKKQVESEATVRLNALNRPDSSDNGGAVERVAKRKLDQDPQPKRVKHAESMASQSHAGSSSNPDPNASHHTQRRLGRALDLRQSTLDQIKPGIGGTTGTEGLPTVLPQPHRNLSAQGSPRDEFPDWSNSMLQEVSALCDEIENGQAAQQRHPQQHPDLTSSQRSGDEFPDWSNSMLQEVSALCDEMENGEATQQGRPPQQPELNAPESSQGQSHDRLNSTLHETDGLAPETDLALGATASLRLQPSDPGLISSSTERRPGLEARRDMLAHRDGHGRADSSRDR